MNKVKARDGEPVPRVTQAKHSSPEHSQPGRRSEHGSSIEAAPWGRDGNTEVRRAVFSPRPTHNTLRKPEHSSTKLPLLRFVLPTAKCYLSWPPFPHGLMFHQHKRQPVPPEPGPAGPLSADPDTAGGWTPICSEAENLGKHGQTDFLDSNSGLGKKSLVGPCIPFIDPGTTRADTATGSIPK